MRFVVVQLEIYCWEGGIEASSLGHAAKAQNLQLPFAEADRPTTKGEGAARLRANPAIATSPFSFLYFLSFLSAFLVSKDISSLCLPEPWKVCPILQLRQFARKNDLFYLSSPIAALLLVSAVAAGPS